MKKGKNVEIKISDKVFYVLFVIAIIFLGVVTVNALVGHDVGEIEGICNGATGDNCSFLSDYNTKTEYLLKMAEYTPTVISPGQELPVLY